MALQEQETFATTVNSKYHVKNHMYPYDLFSPDKKYGGNYVVFYINIQEDSKLLSEEGGYGIFNSATVQIDDSERFRSRIAREGYTDEAAIAGQTIQGGVAGTIFGALGGGGNSGGSGVQGAAIGGGLGAAQAAAIKYTTGGKIVKQQKRLATAIALYVPNQLTASYSMQWDAEDTGLFQAAAKLGEAGIKAAMDWNPDTKGELGGVAKSVVAATALGAPGAGGLQKLSGMVNNPKKEQLFKGVDFRTFTFDYQFSPRDNEEKNNVLEIIKMFKMHMHPEFKDTSSFIYLYPSEFDIHYYHLNDENKSLFKHTSCVLTNMSVNYTPNAQFNTFGDGTPSQINVQLQFKELAILTKDEINQGF